MRLLIGILLGLGGLLGGTWFALPAIDLSRLLAGRVAAALGQPVNIGSLHLTPGATLRVALRDAQLGDPAAPLAKLGQLEAGVTLASLLRGPLMLRDVRIEDAEVVLPPAEAEPTKASAPLSRAALPLLEGLSIRRLALRRAADAAPLATIAALTLATDSAAKLTLQGEGTWGTAPVTLSGMLDPLSVLRDPALPYGLAVQLGLAGNTLDFTGQLADPLAADGVTGQFALKAPSLAAALQLAEPEAKAPTVAGGVTLAGRLERQGGTFRLADVTGDLAGSPIKAPLLELVTGAGGKPPAVNIDLDLADLDVNKLLGGGIGRTLTVQRLRLAPGEWLRVELQGVKLGNIAGGTRPEMARLGRLSAELDPASLGGPLTLRKVVVEDAFLLLEKDKERHRNWRFGARAASTAPAPVNAKPDDRSGLPLITDAVLRRAEIIVRTTSGRPLTTKIAEFSLAAPNATAKMALKGRGSWEGNAATLDATLDPMNLLRQTQKPFPAVIRLGSGRTTLEFNGTFTDPLNVDGAAGKLSLRAPVLRELMQVAGAGAAELDGALDLAGHLEHRGDLWKLTQGSGTLAASPLKVGLFELVEGAAGEPDAVKLDLEAGALDLNRMLHGGGKDGKDSDVPLVVEANPDPRIEAKVRLGQLTFNKLNARDLILDAGVEPSHVTLRQLSLTAYSARVTGRGEAKPAPGGGAKVDAQVEMHEADLETLRLAFGMRPLPVAGRLNGMVTVATQGQRLAQAAGVAEISAVVALLQGSIARQVLQYASLNIAGLFTRSDVMVPMQCLLGVVHMRAGIGEAAPVRLRSAEGTLSGVGTFDLNRQQMDMIIGTDPSTTGSLALDLPVRLSGSFSNPSIRPATWSGEGRAKLASEYAVARVSPELRHFAERNPCFTLTGPAPEPVSAAPPPRRRR